MVHWYWANAGLAYRNIWGSVEMSGEGLNICWIVQILGKWPMLSGGENNIGFEAYNIFGYSLDKLKIELHG